MNTLELLDKKEQLKQRAEEIVSKAEKETRRLNEGEHAEFNSITVELEDIEAGSHVNHVIDRVIGQVIAHAKGVQFTVAYRLLGHHVIAVQERQTAVIQKIPQVVAIHVKARDACAAREFRDDLGRRAG